jgi:hypothetical protein
MDPRHHYPDTASYICSSCKEHVINRLATGVTIPILIAGCNINSYSGHRSETYWKISELQLWMWKDDRDQNWYVKLSNSSRRKLLKDVQMPSRHRETTFRSRFPSPN